MIYFVVTATSEDVAEALAQECGHPWTLHGEVLDDSGKVDRTAPHSFGIGMYATVYPFDGTLPDGSREFAVGTEYPDTIRAVFARLGGREIAADEVRS